MRKKILTRWRTFCIFNWLKLRINFVFTCKISIRMFKDFLLLILKSDSNQSNIRLSNNEKGIWSEKSFFFAKFSFGRVENFWFYREELKFTVALNRKIKFTFEIVEKRKIELNNKFRKWKCFIVEAKRFVGIMGLFDSNMIRFFNRPHEAFHFRRLSLSIDPKLSTLFSVFDLLLLTPLIIAFIRQIPNRIEIALNHWTFYFLSIHIKFSCIYIWWI